MTRPSSVRPGAKGVSHSPARLTCTLGEPVACQPSLMPPAVLTRMASRNIAPPRSRTPSVGTPNMLISMPRLRCMPFCVSVLVAKLVTALGWLIWKALSVVVNLPQSILVPNSNCVD
jgi:hypothetical protein